MMILKIGIAATVIGFTSWLSGKKPELAGFIIALPIASLLALAFSHLEHKDAAASITFAKSILIGVPVSWLFFAPFFFADRLGGSFWLCYAIGLALLAAGFFLHRYMTGLI
jgi:hypothetical protein